MLLSRRDLEGFLSESFPIGAPEAELTLAPPDILFPVEGGGYRLRIRLVIYENGSVRDIKEQDVFVGALDPSQERLGAFIEGFRAAFAKLDIARLDTAMPHDLVHFDVLGQKRASTAADFEKALLTKKRLGPYVAK